MIAVDLREVVLVIASEEVILETVQGLTEAVLLRVVISLPGKLREENDLVLHTQVPALVHLPKARTPRVQFQTMS